MTSQNLTLALAELHARMVCTGTISESHRRVLAESLGSPELDQEERSAIDRLLIGPAGQHAAIAHDD